MLVAIATLIMMFGGGGSLEQYLLDIKKPVKAAVESKATVNEILDLSKALKKQLKVQNKEITRLRESFLDLHTKYDAGAADMETLLEKLITAREEGQKHILNTRSNMQKLMTKEEWTTVFSLKEN
jgi:hypothetical protein